MIQERPDGTVIVVRVSPRSSRSLVEGVVDGSVKVRLTAPPVDGAANEALIKLLAAHFKISKARVEIVSGARGRHKQVLLRDVDAASVEARLGLT